MTVPAPARSPAVRPIDVETLRREEFPDLGPGAYLNAAAIGPLPARTRRAVDEVNRLRADPGTWPDEAPWLDAARSAVARLIGGAVDEVALAPNTSFGINLAAQCLPLPPDSTIVVSDREFPGNIYAWMGPDCSARVELVPTDTLGRPDEAAILERLGRGDVSALAVSAVQFATGYRADLRGLGEACRAAGAFFVVDGMQALGHVPIDVAGLGIDILAGGGWKWLCAPFGSGFVYVRRALHARMEPRLIGWNAMVASSDVSGLLDYRYEFLDSARRFEVGTQPVQDAAGLAASIGLLLEVGIDRIDAHVRTIQAPLIAWLRGHPGFEIASDLSPGRRSAILAFRPPSAERTFAALGAAGVRCALREGAIRVSPHLYNARADIDRMLAVLEEELRTA